MESRTAPREARSDLNEAIRLDPSDAEAYLYRGILNGCYIWSGTTKQRSEAVADFDRARELNPALATGKFFFSRAECLASLQRWKEADADCQKAMELDPSSGANYYLGGYIAWSRGEKARALHLLEEAASRAFLYQILLREFRATGKYPYGFK